MNALTANDVRGRSLLDFEDKGFAPPVGSDPDPLQREVDMAAVWVEETSGRLLSALDVDSNLGKLAILCVQLKTEQQVVKRSDDFNTDFHEDALDITVPGYSQKRVDPRDRTPRLMVSPLPELHDAMWLLMTPEARDDFLSKFRVAPAEEWTDFGYDTPGVGA